MTYNEITSWVDPTFDPWYTSTEKTVKSMRVVAVATLCLWIGCALIEAIRGRYQAALIITVIVSGLVVLPLVVVMPVCRWLVRRSRTLQGFLNIGLGLWSAPILVLAAVGIVYFIALLW